MSDAYLFWHRYVTERGFEPMPNVEHAARIMGLDPRYDYPRARVLTGTGVYCGFQSNLPDGSGYASTGYHWYLKNGFVFGCFLRNPPSTSQPFNRYGDRFVITHSRRNKIWRFVGIVNGKSDCLQAILDAIADPRLIPLCASFDLFGDMFGPMLKGEAYEV